MEYDTVQISNNASFTMFCTKQSKQMKKKIQTYQEARKSEPKSTKTAINRN